MEKRQIVNIVNFVRALEPRHPEVDLLGTVKKQAELMQKHGLRGTFLFQYDVLIEPTFMEFFKSLDPQQFEFGVWHEVVEAQCAACGIEWHGRWAWDFHTHCGFPVGYTKEQRERLIDVLYEKFRELFGYYPRVFGSWLFDSHTVRYLTDTYGADALCNCKEQFGTDGYTLWGGYYGQAYYPRRSNVFLPALGEGERIDAPLFRMLGSDQVYQYDYRVDPNRTEARIQGVITLEPAILGSGGDLPEWVDWYMKENYNGECLSFGYAQAGQENPFGWERIGHGLTYQCEQFEKLQREGKLTVEPMGETGRWFKETFCDTPASAITAHTAYDDAEKNSVWYCTKYYRINLFGDHGDFRIRDIHLFTADYPDVYDEIVCTENHATYEALPFIEGMRSTGCGIVGGGYITYKDGTAPRHTDMVFTDDGDGKATVTYGELTIKLYENGVIITAPKPFTLENRIGLFGDHLPECTACTKDRIHLSYGGVRYAVRLAEGTATNENTLTADGGVLHLVFDDCRA